MALRDVEWQACVLEPRRDPALEAHVRGVLGTVPSAVPYFTAAPWVVRSMVSLGDIGAPLAHLEYVLADLIALVVSQDNSCRYCFAAQHVLMRVHGLPPARIRQIEQDFLEAEIDPRSKLALDFARRISRASPMVSAPDAAPLRAAGWSVPAIKELSWHAAYSVYMNRLMTEAAIPPDRAERMSEHWALGWIAPLARLVMRRRWRRAQPAPLAPGAEVGPWSELVRALGGLSVAPELRRTLDEAWASPLVPRRAKALVFAVIARGLGCPLGEREATRLAIEEGFPAAELEVVLRHLASPALDSVEAALVPFARGTIRGRPAQLQQRTQALQELLDPEQIVEVVGVTALANALCRLDVVTQLA
jgi:AhpD family alkylhydroperoxidase